MPISLRGSNTRLSVAASRARRGEDSTVATTGEPERQRLLRRGRLSADVRGRARGAPRPGLSRSPRRTRAFRGHRRRPCPAAHGLRRRSQRAGTARTRPGRRADTRSRRRGRGGVPARADIAVHDGQVIVGLKALRCVPFIDDDVLVFVRDVTTERCRATPVDALLARKTRRALRGRITRHHRADAPVAPRVLPGGWRARCQRLGPRRRRRARVLAYVYVARPAGARRRPAARVPGTELGRRGRRVADRAGYHDDRRHPGMGRIGPDERAPARHRGHRLRPRPVPGAPGHGDLRFPAPPGPLDRAHFEAFTGLGTLLASVARPGPFGAVPPRERRQAAVPRRRQRHRRDPRRRRRVQVARPDRADAHRLLARDAASGGPHHADPPRRPPAPCARRWRRPCRSPASPSRSCSYDVRGRIEAPCRRDDDEPARGGRDRGHRVQRT